MRAYAERWLGLLAVVVKPRTLTMYRSYLSLHLLPVFGATKVRQLAKGRIKELLAQKVRIGFSRASVELMLAVLRGMLNAAIEDGVILANPTDRVARQLRLSHAASARQDEIKAMTREQLVRFVAAPPRPCRARSHSAFSSRGPECGLARRWPSNGRI